MKSVIVVKAGTPRFNIPGWSPDLCLTDEKIFSSEKKANRFISQIQKRLKNKKFKKASTIDERNSHQFDYYQTWYKKIGHGKLCVVISAAEYIVH